MQALIGPAISGITGVISGIFGRHDIDKAMDYYRQQMDEAKKTLAEHEATGRGDIQSALEASQQYGAPYRQAGEQAAGTLAGSLGIGTSRQQQLAKQAFQYSPAYQFALEQGLQGVQRGMAPGLRGSGAEQKALTSYAQGLANQEYGNWQSNLQNLLGIGSQMAEGAAGREYGSGSQLANLGLNYAGSLADLYSAQGQAGAEGQLAKGQQTQNMIGSIGGSLGDVFGEGGYWFNKKK